MTGKHKLQQPGKMAGQTKGLQTQNTCAPGLEDRLWDAL